VSIKTHLYGEPYRPSILIIDDEPKICMLIKLFLERTERFKSIVTAPSVSVALMKIRNEDFDLVIVDYNLPDKNGTAFIDIMSKSIKYRKMKYLLISGYLDDKAMMEVMSLGVKNVLVKPFTRGVLIDKVCSILKI
jgi:two-component system, chemotaxis family, chemotaxis protein CheY